MFAVKVLGKIIAIPMILVMTVLFYTVTIFSRIYGLAAMVFNFVIMLCAIIALVLQQWNNFGIAVAILVISYLLMDAWRACRRKRNFLRNGTAEDGKNQNPFKTAGRWIHGR